jgi:hypothetical protein
MPDEHVFTVARATAGPEALRLAHASGVPGAKGASVVDAGDALLQRC